MKLIGTCSDDELLAIFKDQYSANASEYILDRLDGVSFKAFLDEAYPDVTAI